MIFSTSLLLLFQFLFQSTPEVSFVTSNKSIDTIYWQSNRKLTWDDFRGKPDRFSESVALTSSGIGMTFRSGADGSPIIDINCTFFSKNSWVKDEGRHPDVLQHEQLHFDLTELYARKLREAIHKLSVDKRKWPEISKIYRTLNNECDDRQNAYDRETYHGIKEDLQKMWNAQIEAELVLLEQFRSDK